MCGLRVSCLFQLATQIIMQSMYLARYGTVVTLLYGHISLVPRLYRVQAE